MLRLTLSVHVFTLDRFYQSINCYEEMKAYTAPKMRYIILPISCYSVKQLCEWEDSGINNRGLRLRWAEWAEVSWVSRGEPRWAEWAEVSRGEPRWAVWAEWAGWAESDKRLSQGWVRCSSKLAGVQNSRLSIRSPYTLYIFPVIAMFVTTAVAHLFTTHLTSSGVHRIRIRSDSRGSGLNLSIGLT